MVIFHSNRGQQNHFSGTLRNCHLEYKNVSFLFPFFILVALLLFDSQQVPSHIEPQTGVCFVDFNTYKSCNVVLYTTKTLLLLFLCCTADEGLN